MAILQQLLFSVLVGVAIWTFGRKITEIRRNILLGKEEDLPGQPAERWRNVFLLALGQKKMFRKPFVALLHLVVYVGFIIINIEVLEIVLDGILGTHRIFSVPLGNLYPLLINAFECLALLVLLSCVVFLFRRNVLRLSRFSNSELDGWPRNDANVILVTEIVLMAFFLLMNSADTLLQSRGYAHFGDHLTGDFMVSRHVNPFLAALSSPSLVIVERAAWWLHILGILAFLNYLPWSKHLHILLAFPNAYYARIKPAGAMTNMKEVQQEVIYSMQPDLIPAGGSAETPKSFGAKDVMDLSWHNLLDAYSCTECGRCTAACPASLTGKSLSPRKIMMDTRDRLEVVGENIRINGSFKDDGRSLLGDYIPLEALRACTTCNACVQECPVSISPLDIIIQLRRYLIMEQSNAPQEWNAMFGNIENNFAPWKFSPDDRDLWTKDMP
jgi:heterodisulfide reductase subunit C